MRYPTGVADIVGEQEIARRLGVQVRTVHQWRARHLLPEPLQVISGTPIWEWPAVETWAQETGRLSQETPVLTDLTRSVLDRLAKASAPRPQDGFCLAGGTGLALQLTHRVSRDLDFMTAPANREISPGRLLNRMGRIFPATAFVVTHRSREQLDLEVGGLKLSFIAYPFTLQERVGAWGTLALAEKRDIACMKAYAMGRRAVARDYIDIHAVLRGKVLSLDELMERSERMFVLDGERLFDPALFAKQLTYTDDLENPEAAMSDVLDKSRSWQDVSGELRQAAIQWLRRHVVEGGGVET